MKVQRFVVTFASEMDAVVYAPEGTDAEKIEEIAKGIAESPTVSGWDFPEYEASVMRTQEVALSDEDRTATEPNKYGYTRPVDGSLLADEEVCVLSDDGEDIVNPSDAKWWRS